MDPALLNLLEEDNRWLRGPDLTEAWLRARLPGRMVPRTLLAEASARWIRPDKAHLLVGPRQAGKSTLFRAHLAGLGRPALFLDCEQALIRQWCASAPLFLADLEKLLPGPVPLFFDEIQHMDEAALFLKGLVDRRPGVPVLVTGSSAYHLRARTRESLAGRASRLRLLPFSLDEVDADSTDLPPALARRRRLERFWRHLVVGGYPEAWLADEPGPVLNELVESFVIRDASDLYRIERPDAFRRLVRLVAGQAGSLVNHSEWAAVLGVSRDTVAAYLAILADGHVLQEVTPFAGGRRVEVTSRPKVYLLDAGLRNRILGDMREAALRRDLGPLLEGWVLAELVKVADNETTVQFWRTRSGSEVDFVVARGERVIGVEVKASRSPRAVLSRAARSFIEAYRPGAFLMVSTGLEHEETVHHVPVRWLHPVDVAGEVRARL